MNIVSFVTQGAVSRKRFGRLKLLGVTGALVLGAGGLGCNELSCIISGDNLRGRLTYADGITLRPDAQVVIQSSTDQFATSSSPKIWKNSHGLLTFQYSICVENDVDVQVMAFQDTNNNSRFDTGESYGFYDGTANGNGALLSKRVPKSTNGHWSKEEGADVTIDTP